MSKFQPRYSLVPSNYYGWDKWLVYGHDRFTGERESYPVAAFADESDAKAFVAYLSTLDVTGKPS